MKPTACILFLCLPMLLNAYSAHTDSLARNMRRPGSYEARLRAMLAFCEENRSYSYDTLSKYAQEAWRLSAKVTDPLLKARAEFFIALDLYRGNRQDTVQQIAERVLASLPHNQQYARIIDKFRLLKASGLVKQNKQKAAIATYYQLIADAEKWNDTLHYIKGMNGLGWTQMELGQFKAAKKWLFKGLAAAHTDQLKTGNSSLFTNLAVCCGSLNQLDSARYYVGKGIAFARRDDDLPVQANGLNILAGYYIEREQYKDALACVRESMDIRKILGDPFFIVSDMAQLSHLLAKTGKHEEGMQIIRNAIGYASTNGVESKLPLLYLVLSRILYEHKDYKGSSEALFRLQQLQDSLYHKASARELAEMQIKYETARKEGIIQKQQYELSRKNYLLYGSLILLALILLLGIAVLRSRRHRQEVSLQRMRVQEQEKATAAILAAEENERRRIASDLHDGLGQLLTAARFNLNGLADNLGSLPETERQIFAKAAGLVDESCREVRTVSHNIMPNALIKSGLGNALKDFIDKIGNKTLQVDLSITGINERIDPNTEAVAYRIIQECVNNTIRHASASKLHIALIHEADNLDITIEDNGRGFDMARLREDGKGIGMKNIKTRTAYLRGSLDIDSRPGKGTLIAIHIPLKTTAAS